MKTTTKMYLFSFFRHLTFYGAVSIPFFIDWIQISYTQIFLLEAFLFAGIFLLEIPAGVVADRYGRKTSLLLATVAMLICMLIFGLSTKYSMLFIAEFFGALSGALFSGADKALLYDSVASTGVDAKHVLSRYDAAGTAAIVLAFPLGSLFVGSSLVSYPAALPLTFIATAVSAFIAIVVVWTVREPARDTYEHKNLLVEGWSGLRYVFDTPMLRSFAFNSSLIAAVTFFIFWLYQPLSGAAGFPVSAYGFIGAGFNLFGVFLLMNVSRIERFLSMKNLLLITAVLPGVSFLLMAAQKSAVVIFLGIFVIAGAKMLRAPILVDFMNIHIRSSNRATVLSGVSMIEKVSTLVLYPIVGFLLDISLTYTLVVLGVLTLLLAFVTRLEASAFDPA